MASQQLGAQKGKATGKPQPKVQKIQNAGFTSMITELNYGAKANKYVDIKDDDDFPDLGAEEGTKNTKKMAVGAYVMTEQVTKL